jgi:hypothetical protein
MWWQWLGIGFSWGLYVGLVWAGLASNGKRVIGRDGKAS